jgi:uncharacterized protein (DUF1697 family)
MRYVALLRGINVGTAARISMADLKRAFKSAGPRDVRTLLQSGNVVFDADEPPDPRALENAVHSVSGVRAAVVVFGAERFREIAAANPLLPVIDDPSRGIVHFLAGPVDAASVDRPGDDDLAPERLLLGEHAIYQWCPDGVSRSKLHPRFFARLGVTSTGRNVRTVDKLLAMLDD